MILQSTNPITLEANSNQLSTSPYNLFFDSFKKNAGLKDFSHYVEDINQNNFVKTILDALPCAVALVDYQTQRYLYINNAAETAITGYPKEVFLEKGVLFWVSLIHPDDFREYANHSFPKILASLQNYTPEEVTLCKFTYVYRFKRKDNVWIKMLQNSVILEMDEDRNPILLLTMVTDITAYKKDDELHFSISHIDKKTGIANMLTEHSTLLKITSIRENEVIQHIASGTKTKDIAEKMNLSIYTIRAHKRTIFKKTNTKNIAELTSYAFANGLL